VIRINGDRVETISHAEVVTICKRLQEAADALASVRDDAEKFAACQDVFGRRTPYALEAARELEPRPR
jgi:hypothetical protein